MNEQIIVAAETTTSVFSSTSVKITAAVAAVATVGLLATRYYNKRKSAKFAQAIVDQLNDLKKAAA